MSWKRLPYDHGSPPHTSWIPDYYNSTSTSLEAELQVDLPCAGVATVCLCVHKLYITDTKYNSIPVIDHTEWIKGTLQKHLGYFNYILGCPSCISVTKECYQIGFIESSLRSFFLSSIS